MSDLEKDIVSEQQQEQVSELNNDSTNPNEDSTEVDKVKKKSDGFYFFYQ
jgi:hypothetical protein